VSRRFARITVWGALVVTLVVVALLAPRPPVAAAHPLDEYLQAAYLTLDPDGVTVEIDLTPGVLVTLQVVALIDRDGDGAISDDEGQAYARAVLEDVALDVDGQRHLLTVSRTEFPSMLALTAGLGTIRLQAAATAGPSGWQNMAGPGTHQAVVLNAHTPVKSVYQATVALGPAGGIEVAEQHRDDLQQSLRVDYTVAPPAAVSPASAEANGAWSLGGLAERQRWLVDTLYRPAASPWLLVVALGLSAMLGGLHALTPGHGKTLLASYLVGSRGTAWHAVFLGGTVTFTHTASVIATGLLALLAGHLIVPDLLVPTLELSSGLLVVLLGIRLVRTRWRSVGHGHEHDHTHPHDHPHDHHSHEHPEHAHLRPNPADGIRWRDLVAMGVSGGLTPCPEAIGILLIAIGLNRVGFGMGLIVAFSLSLAAVLSLFGLLLVRSRRLVDHLGATGQRTQRLLPLGSAVVVTLLGLGMSAKGVLAYLS
jgi:ABC-type nickel/cobalt efflux system permease component RcnA